MKDKRNIKKLFIPIKRNSDFKGLWYYRLGLCLNQIGQTQKAIESFLNMQRVESKPWGGV